MEEDEVLPGHLWCNCTDEPQWRYKRRVKETMKLCEIHYLQGRHRQNKEIVLESLKLQMKMKKKKKKKKKVVLNKNQNQRNNVQIRAKKQEILAKLMKKKRSGGETLGKVKKLKRGNMEIELITMVLKQEMEKNTMKTNFCVTTPIFCSTPFLFFCPPPIYIPKPIVDLHDEEGENLRCRLFYCVWKGTQLTLSYLESSNERENQENGEDKKVGIINDAIFLPRT